MIRSRKKAPVWQHFDVAENNRAKCKYCPTSVSVQQGTTTNMKSHLRAKHVGKFVAMNGSGGQVDGDCDDVSEEVELEAIHSGEGDSVVVSPSPTSPTPSPSPSPSVFSPPVSPAPSKATSQTNLDAFRCDSKTTERLHFAVAYYIVTCNRPLNTVEKDGFKSMLQAFKPGYKVLSRRTLTDTYLPKCVSDVRECIKSFLKDAEVFALTSDNWTSEADVPFTSLTAHFFDKAWDNLHAVTLSCRATRLAHTGLNLHNFFSDELKAWDLEKKRCSALTTDNASEMRVAAEQLGLPHMRCIGHTVQNGVTDILSLPYVTPVIKAAKGLLSWTSTPRVWNAYVAWAERVHKAKPKALPSISPTRWWTEEKLLEQILESHDHLREFAASFERGKHLNVIPAENTIFAIRALVRVLQPLEEICTNLSADTFVTASAVLPVLHLLEAGFDDDDEPLDVPLEEQAAAGNAWLNFDEEDFNPVRLRQYVVRKLKKRYCPEPQNEDDMNEMTPQLRAQAAIDYRSAEQCHDLLVKCSYLDPRYKEELLPQEKERAKELLIAEFIASVEDREGLRFVQTTTDVSQKKKSLQSLFSRKKRATAAAAGGQAGVAVPATVTPEAAFREEMARFDNLPPVDMDVDMRSWWRERVDAYPKLMVLARKYFSIPATSTTSERLFSEGGNIITDTRCCLSDNNAQQLIFLSSNKKFLKKPL